MRGKVALLAALFACLLPLLSGCWNSRELKGLALIGAMGIDKLPDRPGYKVSFQIMNPSSVAATGGSSLSLPSTVYSGTGESIFEVIRKTSGKSPRQLFFSHIRLLVIGESLARDGIDKLFDFFERSHEIRLTTKLVIARGTEAETLLEMLTPIEKITANAVYGKLTFSEELWSESIDIGVDDFINTLNNPGEQLLISGVRIIGDSEKGDKKANLEQTTPAVVSEVKGIGLFIDGHLKTWLDGDAARGAVWLRDKMDSTIVKLPCRKEEGVVSVEISRSHTKIKAELRGGQPVFRVLVKEEGNVGEVSCAVDLSKQQEIAALEKEWNEETERQIREAVEIAQKYKSDIFGFGSAMRRAHPKAWKKLQNDWNKTFAESEVKIAVDSAIRRSGMRLKPYIK